MNREQKLIYISVGINFLVGIIIGIYLLTRENKDVHKHGIIMIALAIVISIIVFILFFSYMSYVSRMSYYY